MKIVFSALLVALAFLVFAPAMEAAKTPPPTPTPAAITPPVPAPEVALYNQLEATLSQPARAWVTDEAAKAAKNMKTTEGNIRADIQTRFTGQSLTEADKNILLFVVLTETVGDIAVDLGDMVNDFKKNHAQDKNTPAPGGNGSFNITLTPDETMHLQTAMQKRAEFMTALSNVMKKVSGTQGVVVGKLQ